MIQCNAQRDGATTRQAVVQLLPVQGSVKGLGGRSVAGIRRRARGALQRSTIVLCMGSGFLANALPRTT